MKNSNPQLSSYLHQWGATHVPFQDQPNQKLFQTDQTQKALELLHQAASLKSVMLLSGANGVGKSALVSEWLKSLPAKAFVPAVLTHATLSPSGLLWSLCGKLGRTPRYLRANNLGEIQEAFEGFGSVIPVVILDEAQHYSASTIEEVRMLLGLNLPAQPNFALILIGDLYLIDTLRLQSRRALYSRIAISWQLQPLSPDQVPTYLRQLCSRAGIERACFEPPAIQMLAAASEGIPRTLNLLAQSAWIQASSQKANTITCAHVQIALERVPMARQKIQPPTL